jgi:DNA-binding MarR family transcriptional regulator
MPTQGLKNAHSQASASHIQQSALVIDHLIAALGGDPSCGLHRAQTLVDIYAHPQTTQSEIMARLGFDKHTVNRHILWLADHGCIDRVAGAADGRVIHISIAGYAKKNIELSLSYCGGLPKRLQDFLDTFIKGFQEHRPTLRDVKLLLTAVDVGQAPRAVLLNQSNIGPSTSAARALDELLSEGLLQRTNTDG